MLLPRRKKLPGVLRPSLFSGDFFLAAKHYKNTTAVEPSAALQNPRDNYKHRALCETGLLQGPVALVLPESTAISRFRREGS